MHAFLDIFKNSNYRQLFLASFASQFGTVTSTTAFTFYLLDQYANKPYYATLVELMYTLPSLFVFFIVGVLADNINRQKIMIYSDWLNACLCVMLVTATLLKIVTIIFVLLFMITAVSKFFVPAQTAAIQGILHDREYAVAGGLNQMLISIFLLFGTAFGAFFYWNLGISGAILMNCFSFLFSSFLIYHCHFPKKAILPKENPKDTRLNISMIFSEFKQGMVYILRHRLLSALMLGTAVLGFVNGGLSIMPIYLLKYKLAPNDYQQAAAVSGVVFGMGILSGSFVASLIVNKIKLSQLMILGFLIASVFISLEYFAKSFLLYLFFYFCVALCIPIVNVALSGWLPRIVDSRFMGRVQAWFDPIGNLTQSLLFGIIALAFPRYIKVETPFLWFGGCLLFVAIFYMFVFPKSVKTLQSIDS
ncbi:MFS transporter [Sporolactobacillus pectinivorans]|uniref:MFS transporter n=1 Tax=Sporolactobacillus pectinivorans TaxID=1591408 RepID=UPI000C26240A|nr:MFS transporter [Sporolactobacillus pectinivorans]